MKYIEVIGFDQGKEVKIKLSQIIFGAADFFRVDNFEAAQKIIDGYVKAGGTTFDTAHHYRHSDLAIGKYIKNKKREDFKIIAKGGHPVREYPHINRVNRQAIIDDLEASLSKLETEYVDLYALHRDDENIPVSEIMDTLDELVKVGKIKAIGVSNWTLLRIKAANQYAMENNKTPLTFTSPNLSLAKLNKQRWPGCISADEEMISWHRKNNIPMISWSSQASGFFSGNFTPEDKSNAEMVDCFYNHGNWERFERLKKLAKVKGTDPMTLSLSWVLNQDFPVGAIIGPETLEQLNSSLVAKNIMLSEGELKYLNLEKNCDIDYKIAIQLYTLRNEIAKDLRGTIKRLSEMGFKYVQVDGLRGNDIYEFKRVLDQYHMTVVGIHLKHDLFMNNISEIIHQAEIFDCKVIYDKYIEDEDQTLLGYKKTKQKLLDVSQKLSQFGYEVGIHNPEYDICNQIEGDNVLDYLCKPVNNFQINPELDTYWLYVAGLDYVDYIYQYGNRSKLIHLKDIDGSYDKNDLKNNLCSCGKGEIDFHAVIKAGEEVGINYYVIEQDCDAKQDIWKSIEESFNYLKRVGIEVLKHHE